MKHFSDIQPIADMTRADASKIMEEIKLAASDINFITTNASYDIFKWVWNSNVLHNRGVYIFGKSGIGKTFTFLAIRRWQVRTKQKFPVMNVNVKTMEDIYKIEGPEYLAQLIGYPSVAFHNFGYQSDVMNDYGTKRNFMMDILDQRYDFYQQDKKNFRTYITSNMNQDYVRDLGPAISRRITEMMNYREL